MKPHTLLRTLLLLPYLICLVAISPAMPRNLAEFWPLVGLLWGLAEVLFQIYLGSIVIWGIPYTLLAAGLLVWSRDQSAQKIYHVFSLSPILLALLTVVEMLLYGLITEGLNSVLTWNWGESVGTALLAGFLTLFFGYLVVGLGMGIFWLSPFLGLISSESYRAEEASKL